MKIGTEILNIEIAIAASPQMSARGRDNYFCLRLYALAFEPARRSEF
jgi:hypothetical protein